MNHRLRGAVLFVAGLLLAGPAEAACGRVTIADMNWASATLIANVDQMILEHGYGCEAVLVAGDTVPTGTSMIEKGEPDVAPELWTNAIRDALRQGVAEKRLRIAGPSLADGGEEGFWVPKYMVERDPSLAAIEGVKRNARLFTHPEDPAASAFYGCPAGWTCQITAGNLFRALGLADAGFRLVDPGSAAGLAGALARAYERRKAWFGYYWAPTGLLGKYPMVKVDFGAGVDADHYRSCITDPDCANPKPTMYPRSPVLTVTTESFAGAAPEAFQYLARRAFANADMNGLLAWIADNQADGETAAIHVLKTRAPLWTAWVPAAVAAKVKAAVGGL